MGTPRLVDEPAVRSIAARLGKSAAQVLLRWQVQQGVPTQPRSLRTDHMRENLDVFDWALAEARPARGSPSLLSLAAHL